MTRRLFAAALSLTAVAPLATAQTTPESYAVFIEHPRLFLRQQRLRLLRREKERSSLRWDQFRLLVGGGAPMPEAAFAYALYYRITDEEAAGKKAISAALAPNAGVRQMALVYDWCQGALSPSDKEKLKARLHAEMVSKKAASFPVFRDRVLAAVALGDEDPASETALRDLLKNEWEGRIVPELKAGRLTIRGADTYPVFEMLHAIRDTLSVDLRQDFAPFFHQLPLFNLLSYYPPPYPAPENEFHIPYAPEATEPNLRNAVLARAADLAMVAFDTNAPETQVLQGWLMNDHFLMRGTFGIPYELLWANPYQPGLSYYHVPLVLHDELFGQLLVRSSWEDNAEWAGYIGGKLQIFQEGRVVPLDAKVRTEPLDIGDARILFASQAGKVPGSGSFTSGEREANDVFIVGLPPKAKFHIEAQDEEMREVTSDPGGILYLKGLRPGINVRFNRREGAPRSAGEDKSVRTRSAPSAAS